jgi:hypothetical protein
MLDRGTFLSAAASLAMVPQGSEARMIAQDSNPLSITPFETKVTDPGNPPVAYRLLGSTVEKNGHLLGSTVEKSGRFLAKELSQMLGSAKYPTASNDLGARLTLIPLYVSPNSKKYRKGISKEYAALKLTCQQLRPLPVLQEKLSWTNIWYFVKDQRRDFDQAQLPDSGGTNTFERMPVVDGQGEYSIELITGTKNNNAAITLSNIINAISPVINNPGFASLLTIPAASVASANQVTGLLNQTLLQLGPQATFIREFSNGLFKFAVHAKALTAGINGVLRVPYTDPNDGSGGLPATYLFIRGDNTAAFDKFLVGLQDAKQSVAIDSATGRPLVVDSAGNEVAGDPLQVFSVFVMQTKLELADGVSLQFPTPPPTPAPPSTIAPSPNPATPPAAPTSTPSTPAAPTSRPSASPS